MSKTRKSWLMGAFGPAVRDFFWQVEVGGVVNSSWRKIFTNLVTGKFFLNIAWDRRHLGTFWSPFWPTRSHVLSVRRSMTKQPPPGERVHSEGQKVVPVTWDPLGPSLFSGGVKPLAHANTSHKEAPVNHIGRSAVFAVSPAGSRQRYNRP